MFAVFCLLGALVTLLQCCDTASIPRRPSHAFKSNNNLPPRSNTPQLKHRQLLPLDTKVNEKHNSAMESLNQVLQSPTGSHRSQDASPTSPTQYFWPLVSEKKNGDPNSASRGSHEPNRPPRANDAIGALRRTLTSENMSRPPSRAALTRPSTPHRTQSHLTEIRPISRKSSGHHHLLNTSVMNSHTQSYPNHHREEEERNLRSPTSPAEPNLESAFSVTSAAKVENTTWKRKDAFEWSNTFAHYRQTKYWFPIRSRNDQQVIYFMSYRNAAKDLRRCALKCAKLEPRGNEALVMLQNERNALRAFEGKHVIQIYHDFQDYIENILDETKAKHLCLVLELIPGPHLLQYSDINRGLNESDWREIFRCLLLGLKEIHGNDYIYGDMKPENVVVYGDEGKAKIIDAGLMLKMSKLNGLEIMQSIIGGTAGYRPPEAVWREKVSSKSDLWSAGITMYRLIFDKFPNELHLFEARINYADIRAQWSLMLDNLPATPSFRQLLKGLLQIKTEHRFDAKKALNSDWFNDAIFKAQWR